MRLNTKIAETQLPSLFAMTFVFALGCASTQPQHVWTDEALAAEALQSDGQLEEADAVYAELLERAPDSGRARWVRFNRAEIALEQRRTEAAVEMFEDLAFEGPSDLWGANSAWQLALMADGADRRDAMWAVVTRFPDEVAAERALDALVDDASNRGALNEWAARAESVHEEVEGSMIADYLLFRLGFAHEELGDDGTAIEAFARLFRAYPNDSLADDALWEMARIHRERQSWKAALPLLEQIATDVESSWFVGSYASEWVDDSILLLAEINLLYLDDHREAIRWYDYYVAEYPNGFKADDAAWGAVEARRLGADESAHFSAMRQFVREYPESKWSRVARARLGVGGDDD